MDHHSPIRALGDTDDLRTDASLPINSRVSYAAFAGGHGGLAENYRAQVELEAGDVVVIAAEGRMALRRADKENDTAVAGIISAEPALRLTGLIRDWEGHRDKK